MFSALRQGSQVYVLEKGNVPTLKTGSVVSISSPSSFSTYISTVDITVKFKDETVEYKQLPSTLSVANYNNGATILSETKDGMSQEIENQIRTSQQILDSVDYHTTALDAYDKMLRDLNPQFAKQKAQEEEITNLQTKVDGIENKLDSITSMLAKVLDK